MAEQRQRLALGDLEADVASSAWNGVYGLRPARITRSLADFAFSR